MNAALSTVRTRSNHVYLGRHSEIHLQPFGGRLKLGAPAATVRLVETSEALAAGRVPVGGIRRRRRDLRVGHGARRQSQRTVVRTLSCTTSSSSSSP